MDTAERLTPSSRIIGSRKTDTAAVCPGAVAMLATLAKPTTCQP